MKLASLRTANCRDGELCVVNQALTQAIQVGHVAKTLQSAIVHWPAVEKPLQNIYQALNEFVLDLEVAMMKLDGDEYLDATNT